MPSFKRVFDELEKELAARAWEASLPSYAHCLPEQKERLDQIIAGVELYNSSGILSFGDEALQAIGKPIENILSIIASPRYQEFTSEFRGAMSDWGQQPPVDQEQLEDTTSKNGFWSRLTTYFNSAACKEQENVPQVSHDRMEAYESHVREYVINHKKFMRRLKMAKYKALDLRSHVDKLQDAYEQAIKGVLLYMGAGQEILKRTQEKLDELNESDNLSDNFEKEQIEHFFTNMERRLSVMVMCIADLKMSDVTLTQSVEAMAASCVSIDDILANQDQIMKEQMAVAGKALDCLRTQKVVERQRRRVGKLERGTLALAQHMADNGAESSENVLKSFDERQMDLLKGLETLEGLEDSLVKKKAGLQDKTLSVLEQEAQRVLDKAPAGIEILAAPKNLVSASNNTGPR